jgi:hypothetical protein
MAKPNKADKFVKRQFRLGKTRNGVREAIFEKLNTWNFPPEYEEALANQDFNDDTLHHSQEISSLMHEVRLDDYKCHECHECHEVCFCDDVAFWDELGHSSEAERAVLDRSYKAEPIDGSSYANDLRDDPWDEAKQKPCLFCRENPCNCAVIKLPKLPVPGSLKWESMGYSGIIAAAKKSIESRGLNFNEEFKKWKKNKVASI